MRDNPGAIERWRGQVERLRMYPSFQEAVGIDGEAIEFEWRMFPDFRHCKFFKRSTKSWRERTFNPKSSRTRSSSCQCSMTLSGQKRKNDENCIFNVEKFKNYAVKFMQKHWAFLGPVSDEKWYEVSFYAQKRKIGFTSQQNGTAISKKLVTLCSKASVR